MYNPYTSEHLNGDLRKEYFITDKCPIVCVKCYRSEKCKISSVGTFAIVYDRAHYLLPRRSSVQADMKFTLVETRTSSMVVPKAKTLSGLKLDTSIISSYGNVISEVFLYTT